MGKFEVFLLLVGVGALVFFSQMPPAPQRPVVIATGATLDVAEINGLPVIAQFSADAFKVVDGDSIRIETGPGKTIDLRLASIDAPELRQSAGRMALQHLRSITAGKSATFYQTDTDRYQRAVVFMYVSVSNADGVSERPLQVNAQMVADGFAWHATQHSSDRRLDQLQQRAMQQRLGLWADPNPTPPWEHRAQN